MTDEIEPPRWRHGNHQPRNLYRGGQVVGLVDSLDIAEQIIAAMNGDPDRDERLRAEGRRQANHAITWDVTCIGCADRLDRLYEERCAGVDEAVARIVADLRAAYTNTGNRALLHAVAVALGHATKPAETAVEPL
ncbi:hypothetical protein ACWKSP_26415 [Micromonosporaceae bacterium Da 78-11]